MEGSGRGREGRGRERSKLPTQQAAPTRGSIPDPLFLKDFIYLLKESVRGRGGQKEKEGETK